MQLLYFILGTIVASTLICFLERTLQQFCCGRSLCNHCHHILRWFDLLPIVSYLYHKKQCHYCQQPIPKHYMLLEIWIGSTYVILSYLQLSWSYYILIPILIAISYYDIRYHIILPKLQWLLVIYCCYFGTITWNLLWMIIFVHLLYFISQQHIGYGDIKLFVLLSSLIPQPLLFINSAFIIAAIYALFLLIFHKAQLKSKLPLAPFICLSFIFITLFI